MVIWPILLLIKPKEKEDSELKLQPTEYPGSEEGVTLEIEGNSESNLKPIIREAENDKGIYIKGVKGFEIVEKLLRK